MTTIVDSSPATIVPDVPMITLINDECDLVMSS